MPKDNKDPFAQYAVEADSDPFAQYAVKEEKDPDTFEKGGTFEAAAIGGAQALTAGTSDNIIAFTKSLFSSDSYEKLLKEEREKISFAAEKSPIAMGAGAALGTAAMAISPAGVLGRGAKVAKTLSTQGIKAAAKKVAGKAVGTLGKSVAHGAAAGVGISDAETMDDAVVAAVTGGAIGAVVGAKGVLPVNALTGVAKAFLRSKVAKVAYEKGVSPHVVSKLFSKFKKAKARAPKKVPAPKEAAAFRVKKGGKSARLKRQKTNKERREKQAQEQRAEKFKIAKEKEEFQRAEVQKSLDREADMMVHLRTQPIKSASRRARESKLTPGSRKK